MRGDDSTAARSVEDAPESKNAHDTTQIRELLLHLQKPYNIVRMFQGRDGSGGG